MTIALAALAAGVWLAGAPTGPGPASAQEEQAEQAEGAQDTDEAVGDVMERLRERPQAIQSLTRRGRSIDEAPPFEVEPREIEIFYYPCEDCHEAQVTDRRVRELTEDHEDIDFQHGGGRFWCYDACHNAENMNTLRSFRGEEISFNESYKLCGQCHFQRQKDWYFGGHGKRSGAFLYQRDIPVSHEELVVEDREEIGKWGDERVLLSCPACHDAHSPSIKPYEPSPPPRLRTGLEREPSEEPEHARVWTEMQNGHEEQAQ